MVGPSSSGRRMARRAGAALAALLLLAFVAQPFLTTSARAQAAPPAPSAPIEPADLGSGSVAFAGDVQVPLPDPAAPQRVIVTLRAPQPLSPSLAAGRAPAEGIAAARARVLGSLAGRRAPSAVYDTLLAGMALTLSPADRARLEQLPDVQAVYEDRVVTALSLPVAPAARPRQPAADQPTALSVPGADRTGAGIVVAVLDTGVDYTHPDLGGCLGPGCKVAGGYDFVNGDADPRDDNGHGTHVAGIIAASGAVRGAAPEARLLAYKVLAASGAGYTSDIIAALERAADPDGNPATDDAADVVNMSLGAPGDPGDPLALAVDRAVERGMVVVAAAGNAGPAAQTLSSPAVALGAIAVAAADGSGRIAPFSSRGPVAGQPGLLKPDVAAPGVAIRSTVPRSGAGSDPSGYAVMSGTSMAAPYVAGAAALLLQANPSWSPEMVKARLTATAADLGAGLFAQGAGLVDPAAALGAGALVEPGSLWLGSAPAAQGQWSVARTVTLRNTSAAPASYALTAEPSAGVSVSFSPAALVVPPGESRAAEVRFVVDPGALAALPPGAVAYQGALVASGAAGAELRVPWAFTDRPLLSVAFERSPWIAMVHDRGGQSWTYAYPGQSLAALLPAGTYDVLAVFADAQSYSYVLREGLALGADTSIALSPADAAHTVRFRMRDLAGREIPYGDGYGDTGQFSISHVASGARLVFTGVRRPLERFSAMSGAYRFELRTAAQGEATGGALYDLYYRLDGVSASAAPANDPARLRPVEYRFQPPPGVETLRVVRTRVQASGRSFPDRGRTLAAPFVELAYQDAVPADALLPYSAAEVYGGPAQELVQRSPLLRVREDGAVERSLRDSGAPGGVVPLGASAARALPLRHSLPFWAGRVAYQGGQLTIGPAVGSWSWVFLGQGYDVRPHADAPYALAGAGGPLASGTLGDGVGGPWKSRAAAVAIPGDGPFTLSVPYDRYDVAGRPGQALAELAFDTRRADPNPPFLTGLSLLDGAHQVATVPPARGATVRVAAADDQGLARVELLYRVGGAWLPLDVRRGEGYEAQIPPLAEGTVVDLRVVAEDQAGNRLTYTLAPAAVAAEPLDDLAVSGPESGLVNVAQTFTASGAAPGGARYTWLPAGAAVADASGAGSVTLLWSAPGVRSVVVTATNAGGSVSAVRQVTIEPRTVYLPAVTR